MDQGTTLWAAEPAARPPFAKLPRGNEKIPSCRICGLPPFDRGELNGYSIGPSVECGRRKLRRRRYPDIGLSCSSFSRLKNARWITAPS